MMIPTTKRHLEIIGLAHYYEALVKQSRLNFFRRTFSKTFDSDLYKKCEEIYDYCKTQHIDSMVFIKAQFDEWRKPHHASPNFPILCHLGVTGASILRYKRAISKLSPDVEVSSPSELGEAMLKSFCRVRPVDKVFRDPFAVRALPVDFVVQHPEFLAAKAEGVYNDPMSRLILASYLGR